MIILCYQDTHYILEDINLEESLSLVVGSMPPNINSRKTIKGEGYFFPSPACKHPNTIHYRMKQKSRPKWALAWLSSIFVSFWILHLFYHFISYRLLPFIMYSFSDDPGSVRALKRFVSSISTHGTISEAVIL